MLGIMSQPGKDCAMAGVVHDRALSGYSAIAAESDENAVRAGANEARIP